MDDKSMSGTENGSVESKDISDSLEGFVKKRKLVEEQQDPANSNTVDDTESCEHVSRPTEHVSKKPKKGKPGFDSRMFAETTCYRKDGLRYVQPYFFTFTTHCKGRWLGMKLLDIFKKEFRLKTVEYYEKSIQNGKITINNEKVSPDTVVMQNHVIRTMVHRHEPPVVDQQIEFIVNDHNMVVINKPSSIPVHPCGRYRQNTVVFILGKDYGLTNLHTVHRTDRLTSGILMFAKTVEKAQELEQCVKGRLVQKEYICRVVGKFPEESICCNQPIKVASHKVGVCRVDPDGKEAKTEFHFVNYNGESSVVRCVPNTGRMHQIRVHLQYIGYPIVNDPIYNHPTAWGENQGKGGTGRNIDDVLADLAASRKDIFVEKSQNINSTLCKDGDSKPEKTATDSSSIEVSSVDSNTGDDIVKSDANGLLPACNSVKQAEGVGEQVSFDEDCHDCSHPMPDPKPNELIMCLHALSYKGPGWEYETKMPNWADVDWHSCADNN